MQKLLSGKNCNFEWPKVDEEKVMKWKMPKWMRGYQFLICNTGGNNIEDLMNGTADPQVNLPLSTLQACVKSQVSLLEALHDKEWLCPLPLSMAMDMAMELGYKECERGHNIQLARQNLIRTLVGRKKRR